MKLSRYTFAHKVDQGWWGLYTPFEHGVSFVSDKVLHHVEAGEFGAIRETTVAELRGKKFLVEDGFDETCLEPYRDKATTRINAMYLVVIQKCNLACRYCVVENNVVDPARMKDRMSVKTAMSSIDHFARLLDGASASEARVTFYGGEPLLNPDVIMASVPRIRNIQARGLRRPVEAVMITNATVYNEDVADLFKKYHCAICISLDGMAEQHDAARITTKGLPTHSTVIETIRRYQDKGIQLGASCTIGRHNVDSLPELAKYIVSEVGIKDLEFQMPYQVPDEGNRFYVSMSDAADQMLRAATILMDELGVDEYTTLRRLESFTKGYWRHRDCGAAGGQIVISPTGKIGPCHSLVGSGSCFNGDVNDPNYDLFQDQTIAEWSSRIPVNMPQCEGCAFIALCGGGCPYNALTAHGTIWEKDPQVCPYLEKLVPWILDRLWKNQRASTVN
jgi:uncharacterized protein